MADVTPEELNAIMRRYQDNVTYRAMSQACAKALRPVRRIARRRNFGFTDRTGETRKAIGPIRQYKNSTARRYKGGGAYFRGPGIIGARLEYDYGQKYSFLRPARDRSLGAQFNVFVRAANEAIEKETDRLRRGGR